MADELGLRRAGAAALFLLGVDAAYNVQSASNSSPQTTELFGRDREETLMKWVWLGNLKILLYTGFASILGGTLWPLLGGAIVATEMHASYRYAVRCSKRNGASGPPTVAGGHGNEPDVAPVPPWRQSMTAQRG